MTFYEKLKAIYRGLILIGSYLQSPILFLMRLYWGTLFFIAGTGKLSNIPHVSEYFGSLGIPLPTLNAYAAGLTESIGGLLLVAGFASRLITIPIMFVMIVAYLTAHISAVINIYGDPQTFVSQSPFNFLLTALIVFAFGPGRISVDYVLQKYFFKEKVDTSTL